MPTTTTTSTTTTTTAKTSICTSCIEGIIVEVIYVHEASDATKLGPGYTMPAGYSPGGHVCNRALFGILFNGTFTAIGQLNNSSNWNFPNGLNTPPNGQYNGYNVCEDYNNIHPNWSSASKSRYSKTIISKSIAQSIINNTSSTQNFVTISLQSAMQSFTIPTICRSCTGSSICDSSSPHGDLAWIRITSRTGDLIYNGTLSTASPQANLYICDICLKIEHRTKINPATYEERISSGFVVGLYNNKPYYRVTDDKNQYKTIGYIVWRNNKWEFHEKFNPSTGQVSGKFYGENSSQLSLLNPIQAGTWTMNTQTSAIDQKKIVSGTHGCICTLLEDKSKCSCTYAGFKKDDDLTGMKRYYEIYLPKLKKIQDEEC